MNPGKSSATIADVRHEVAGPILVTELVGRAGINVLGEYVMSHHDEWAAHNLLIYDVRDWNVESLTADSLRGLPETFKSLISIREQAWVALVIAPHLEELARILVAIYEAEGIPVEITYFFDRAQAEAWLLGRSA